MTMESAVMAASLATPAQRVEGVPKGADAGGASGRGTEEAIAFNDVTVRFTTERGTVTALENIAFSIQRGSFLSLLGPSGCGKSTLLRVIADLIQPSAGSATVLGTRPQVARQSRQIGFDHLLHRSRTPTSRCDRVRHLVVVLQTVTCSNGSPLGARMCRNFDANCRKSELHVTQPNGFADFLRRCSRFSRD